MNQLSGGVPSLLHHPDEVAFVKRHHKQHSSEAQHECCLVLGQCSEWHTEACVQRRQLWRISKTFPSKIKMTLGKGREASVSLMSAIMPTAVFINPRILHWTKNSRPVSLHQDTRSLQEPSNLR